MTVRRFALLMFIGFAIVVAIGIGLLALGEELAGSFLLVVGCAFSLGNAALIWASRQHLGVGRELELTGRVIARVRAGGARWEPQQQAWAWTGGGNVPAGAFGRFNATVPLAVLEFRPSTLTMRLRPRLLTTVWFGVESPSWDRHDVISIYPVRGRRLRLTRGVAITTETTRSYFWTLAPEPILASLELEGYPVSWDERYCRLWS